MDQQAWNFDEEEKEEEEEEQEGHLALTKKYRMCYEVNLCYKKQSLFCVCFVSFSGCYQILFIKR